MVGTPQPKSLASRLFWSFAPPVALTIATRYLVLPGITDEFVALMSRASGNSSPRATLGVFALGIMPFVSAYIFVELVSLAVPRLSRLRHGNPEGRAKLERAARLLSIALAALQAFGVARSLDALGSGPDAFGGMPAISIPLVTASLVGGFCVVLLVADLVTRQGLVNGYFALLVISAVPTSAADLRAGLAYGMTLGALHPRHGVIAVGAVALVAAATWLALRGAAAPVGSTATGRDAPAPALYRDARALTVHPWLPIPSSSFAAYTIATSIFAVPTVLRAFLPSFGPLDARLQQMSATSFVAGVGVALVATTILLTRVLHRPAEVGDLAGRLGLGGAGDAEVATGVREARRSALLPTLLFFATFLLAAHAAGAVPHLKISLMMVPVAVALVMDLATSLRVAGYVSVWQERRASAVPVILAALAAKGIVAKTRGMHTLALFQAFAPYAPADIVVRAEDAALASSTLRYLLLGESPAEDTVAAPAPAPAPPSLASSSERQPLARTRRTALLAGMAGAAVALMVLVRVPIGDPVAPPSRRAKLDVVRIDDAIDPIAQVPESAIPAGVEVRYENAPTGESRHYGGRSTSKVSFVRVAMNEGESLDHAIERGDAWVRTIAVPEGKRFAWQPDDEYDVETGTSRVVGARTYLLTGDAIVTNEDIVDAVPALNSQSGIPEVYVAVTLTPRAGDRFGDATRDWTNRRIAILLDGRITSAPVVKSEIRGGRMSVTMGAGDHERQIAQAKELASGFAAGR